MYQNRVDHNHLFISVEPILFYYYNYTKARPREGLLKKVNWKRI